MLKGRCVAFARALPVSMMASLAFLSRGAILATLLFIGFCY